MKKLILMTVVLALALPASRLAASPDFDSVKDKVAQIAKRTGADSSVLEREFPVISALRSEVGKTVIPRVDNVLILSALAAGAAAAKEGGATSLMDPRDGTAGTVKMLLSQLRSDLADGKGSKHLGAAAKLHMAAARVLKYGASPTYSIRRSEPAKTSDEVKLELAAELADVTALYLDKAGH